MLRELEISEKTILSETRIEESQSQLLVIMSHANLFRAARQVWRASAAIPRAATRPFSVSPRLETPPILLEDKDKGFGFIRHNSRPPKPRSVGVTEIRGPYYSVMGKRYLQDVLET